jgi:hypothetical protein
MRGYSFSKLVYASAFRQPVDVLTSRDFGGWYGADC